MVFSKCWDRIVRIEMFGLKCLDRNVWRWVQRIYCGFDIDSFIFAKYQIHQIRMDILNESLFITLGESRGTCPSSIHIYINKRMFLCQNIFHRFYFVLSTRVKLRWSVLGRVFRVYCTHWKPRTKLCIAVWE